MAKDKKMRFTLTDEDMITSSRISRRSLLAGAGIALGGVALAGRPALAADSDEEQDKVGADKDDGEDKDKADADVETDTGEDKDKADADADTEADEAEAERDSD